MGTPTIMQDLALIMILATIAVIIFKTIGQPVILGYIVAGFVASSKFELTPCVVDEANVEVWSKIGVIFLLFALGLEFSFKKLFTVGRGAFIAAGVAVIGMIGLGYIIGNALSWGSANSLMLGCMICMSSTTLILKALDDQNLRNHGFVDMVFGMLIFEDLIAILIIVVISAVAAGDGVEGSALVTLIAKMAFFIIVWIVFGIYFLPTILRKARGQLNQETLVIMSVGLCFGMVYFAEYVGFSAEFGAFIMGSILAETLEAERIGKVVSPIKDLFGAIFFISVGMMIDPVVLVSYWKEILIISIGVIVGDLLFGTIGTFLGGSSLRHSIQCGFSLTQLGEFSFIVAMLGTQLKLCDDFLYPIIVAVSVVTVFVTPFTMKLAIPCYEKVNNWIPIKYRQMIERAQNTAHNEKSVSVWKVLLIQMAEIVAIYSVITIAISLLFFLYIIPASNQYGLGVTIVVCCVSVIVTAPFIRAVAAKKNHSNECRYLLSYSKRNWFPLGVLIGLKMFLACTFIFLILYHSFPSVNFLILSVLSVLLLICMMYSRSLKYVSIKIERRFFHNLYSREYEKRRIDEKNNIFKKNALSSSLSYYDLHLADFKVSQNAPCAGLTLIETNFRNRYGVHIVSIIRGIERINIPGGRERIMPSDRVLALGTDEQLTAISNEFKTPQNKIDTAENIEVTIEQLTITENSHLLGKTILESGIRDNAKCLVVGIEKNGEAEMSPSINTPFEMGDIVWIVGEKEKIKDLVKSNLTSVATAK